MAVIIDKDGIWECMERIRDWLPDGKSVLITKTEFAFCSESKENDDRNDEGR